MHTSGWCPLAARLLDMIKEEVGGLPVVDAVDVEVVWDPAWTPERMSEGARENLLRLSGMDVEETRQRLAGAAQVLRLGVLRSGRLTCFLSLK